MGQPLGVIIRKNPWWPTINFWYVASYTLASIYWEFQENGNFIKKKFSKFNVIYSNLHYFWPSCTTQQDAICDCGYLRPKELFDSFDNIEGS